MNNKNYQKIAREILDNQDFDPLQIRVAPKHRQRLEGVADAMDLTVQECATFMLYSFINDMELMARLEQQKMNN